MLQLMQCARFLKPVYGLNVYTHVVKDMGRQDGDMQ